MKSISLIILSLFLVVATNTVSAQEGTLRITHGPWLQNVTDTSATVVFTTDRFVVPGVMLRSPDKGFTLVRNSHDGMVDVGDGIHQVHLSGLQPGNEYDYRVYAKEILDYRPYSCKYGDSIVSETFKFRTFDPAAKEIRFTVFNDIHDRAGMLGRFFDGNDIASQDFYIFNGDILSYFQKPVQPYRSFIDTCVNRFAAEKPFFYVRGNHEIRGMYARDLKSYIDLPGDKYYYSMTIGPVRFIMLDGGEDKPDTSKAYFGLADYDNYRLKQLEWLKKEVQTEAFKKTAFRVVVIHMPVIERKDNWYGMAFLAKHYGPVLEKAGIDLMISGHTHENEWISADSSGFGYPVMIASNHNFTEFTATDKQISIRLKDIKGKVVGEHNVNHSSWFSRALEFKGVAVEDKDYTIWGCAPIQGDDGKIHIFAARWPQKNVDPAWRKSSEIAHYVSDNPEGPFVFSDVAIKGTGRDTWDKYAPHNPEIKKVGDKYVLLYIANTDYHQPPHPSNQSIGMAIADSPYGPWRKVGKDGQILNAEVPGTWCYRSANGVVNPAFLEVDGKFYLYFKARGKEGLRYGLAVADNLEGPYVIRNEPITDNSATLEDATAFYYNDTFYLLTTDNQGKNTGIVGGGTLWSSKDGLIYRLKDAKVAYNRLPFYYPEYNRKKVTRIYGADPKIERPKILMIDGKLAYLYGVGGWNIYGGKRAVSYVFKINLDKR